MPRQIDLRQRHPSLDLPEQMRLMLFDWAQGGHHPIYIRRFAEALNSLIEISVAAPDSTMSELVDLSFEMIPLGRARPGTDVKERLRTRKRHSIARELELLAHAADRAGADHVLHLYADSVVPRLATTRSRGIRLTTVLFYPRAHCPDAFDVHPPVAERVRAAAKEAAVAGWRRRRHAHAVMTLDEEAARRWSAKRGAPAYWVPEPTVESPPLPLPGSARSGCILYGALADRKGIDLLARAIGSDVTPIPVTVAGEPDSEFLPRLRELLAEMSRGGASVELRAHRHTETEGLHALASARCAVLPYPRHDECPGCSSKHARWARR